MIHIRPPPEAARDPRLAIKKLGLSFANPVGLAAGFDKDGMAPDAWLADLPGYGYAAVARDVKRSWQDLLWEYVTTRSTLIGLVLVTDARHGLKELDMTLLAQFVPSARPVLVLATKCDKLNVAEQAKAVAGIRSQIAATFPAKRSA